ncbi:MAG TPA: ribokinase [Atopostipes sp.]|nr:ribokinase [Atopostipes sp.]
MKKIMVIGSISTDFNVQTDRRPKVGETVKGQRFSTSFGGKGANQAVAAARLGANVHMVGTVGSDEFGHLLIDNLEANGISTTLVEQVNNVESGSAHIILADNDNSIIYIPGANNEFKEERLDKLKDEMKTAEYVIIQNEIPMPIISGLIEICDELSVKIIYNPAPAEEMDLDLIDKVTYFTPNENEFSLLFPELTLEEGLKTYPNKLIITLGDEGVAYSNGEEIIQIPSYKVKVKDTTGAGDTFNGALAYALSVDADLKTSIQFANLVAAISIQKDGAQGGMPTLEEVIRNEDFNPEWTIQ